MDDIGARHRGHNGACTQIGNELFASFASTDSKSRAQLLRDPPAAVHRLRDQRETAVGYWQRQKLPVAVVDSLCRGPQAFADLAAWHDRSQELGITRVRHARIATEGASLGNLLAHGVVPRVGDPPVRDSTTSWCMRPARFTPNGRWPD